MNEAIEIPTTVETSTPEATPVGTLVVGKIGILNVKDENGNPLYEGRDIPYEWYKISNFAELFAAEGHPLSDDQINFLGEVFPGEAAGKVIASLIELYNDKKETLAYSAKSQSIRNQYKPVTEEDKTKAFERAVKDLVKSTGMDEVSVRALLAGAKK